MRKLMMAMLLFFTVALSVSSPIKFSEAQEVKYLYIATGTIGGSYYPLGQQLAEIWNSNIPNIHVIPKVTGGTVNNLELLREGNAHIAFLDGLYYYAYHGMGRYEGTPHKFIRAMAPLYPEPVQVLVAKGSNIKTLRDLKGKIVSIGAQKSGTEVTARELLRAAMLDPDKDIQGIHLGVYDTAKAFREKKIDAAIMVGTLEMAGVKEATDQGLVELLEIPSPVIKKVIYQTPYWVPFTIPANTYKGQDRDIKTYASWNILAVHQNLKADLVYELTKHFYAHKDKLEVCRKTMKTAIPENINYILIPLHEGAEKYYNELESQTP